MNVTKVAKIWTKTRKRIIKKKKILFFFCSLCYSKGLNAGWYYSWNQWSYTQYQNNYSWHSDRVQSDNRFSRDHPEGWGAAVWWKWRNIRKGQSPDRGWRKKIIIRVFFCLSNDDRKAEVDVTTTVYLHWMVKWKCPPIFLSISPKPPCHIFFFLFFLPPNQNLPVSALPRLLPNVLKTG